MVAVGPVSAIFRPLSELQEISDLGAPGQHEQFAMRIRVFEKFGYPIPFCLLLTPNASNSRFGNPEKARSGLNKLDCDHLYTRNFDCAAQLPLHVNSM